MEMAFEPPMRIPCALRSYTRATRAEAVGDALGALVADLDRRHPGFPFRIVDEQDRLWTNMRVFVNGVGVADLAQRCGRATTWPSSKPPAAVDSRRRPASLSRRVARRGAPIPPFGSARPVGPSSGWTAPGHHLWRCLYQ